MKLTQEEQQAISKLEELAKTWPKSLWLFSASGELWVMKKKNGKKVVTGLGGMDQDYAIESINIDNDGGDW